MTEVRCSLCRNAIDPMSPTIWRKTVGWERKAIGATRRSGSDIALREHLDEFACNSCVKLKRSGLSPMQGALL